MDAICTTIGITIARRPTLPVDPMRTRMIFSGLDMPSAMPYSCMVTALGRTSDVQRALWARFRLSRDGNTREAKGAGRSEPSTKGLFSSRESRFCDGELTSRRARRKATALSGARAAITKPIPDRNPRVRGGAFCGGLLVLGPDQSAPCPEHLALSCTATRRRGSKQLTTKRIPGPEWAERESTPALDAPRGVAEQTVGRGTVQDGWENVMTAQPSKNRPLLGMLGGLFDPL